jgi:hypothetical protein
LVVAWRDRHPRGGRGGDQGGDGAGVGGLDGAVDDGGAARFYLGFGDRFLAVFGFLGGFFFFFFGFVFYNLTNFSLFFISSLDLI